MKLCFNPYYLYRGWHWDFRFCGFGYFLDRFYGSCAKKLQFFRYGYTWANPWEVHASRMTPKALTIRRGSRALNDEYGVAVRRRTVRQETTMAKHGTLPEFLYQRHLEVGDQVTGYP